MYKRQGGILAGRQADKAAEQAQAIRERQIQEAVAELEAIGYPTEEALRVVYEQEELVGEAQAINYQDSALEDIQTDPRLQQAQLDALNQLVETGNLGGLSVEDQLAFDQTLDQVNQDDQSRQKGILQSLAQSGTLDSGSALIAKLNSSANATQNALQAGREKAIAAAQAKRDALSRAGNLAQSIETTDFNRQQQVANARDTINQYNARNQQDTATRNLDARQNIANSQVATANNQSERDVAAKQQAYQYELDRFNTKQGLNKSLADNNAQFEEDKGQRRANQFAGVGSGVGDILGSFGGK